MALPPNFLDELRARTPMAPLIGRTVKLTRSGLETKGCCPFHGEKTPSFYIYDGHYHCFGCGEHGDAITFVMKTTGADFREAVEVLAHEAGLDVPKANPRQAEEEARRADIGGVLAAAGAVYQRWLYESRGAQALDYLRRRGLTDETIQKFGVGWSGEGRGTLAAALKGQGIGIDQLLEAGLMKQGERGPVDMFFSRVMFPIQDRRGHIVSFSGRLLGDGQPKYVNGPETVVFSKRRNLYGLNFARDPVCKGAPLILVEGQMDVIALSQAGFLGAVAPLGTALTQDQLDEVWRLTPEPVICFDADAAGRRATLKAVDLALAVLAADRSLKFLRLPEKEDPDSLIRSLGASAFKARLDGAEKLSVLLFDMLAEGVARDTPEARASFHKRLLDTASRIPDTALRAEYRSLLLDRFFIERRGAKGNRAARQHPAVSRPASAKVDTADANLRRVRIMTASLIVHPEIFADVEEAFARLPLPPECLLIREALKSFSKTTGSYDKERLRIYLAGLGLTNEVNRITALSSEDHRPDPNTSLGEVVESWWGWYILMDSSIEMLRQQRDEQQRLWVAHPHDAEAWKKLVKYNQLLQQAMQGELE